MYLSSFEQIAPFVFVSFLKISVMRPPNYTLLMIWIPVLILAVIVGYMKRENLHVLYETRYWAIAAMVCEGESERGRWI